MPIDTPFIHRFVRETFRLDKPEPVVDKKLSVLDEIERKIAGVKRVFDAKR